VKKPSTKMAKLHQGWLADYLDIDLDPYDFMHELRTWAKAAKVKKDGDGRAIDDETSPHELSDKQREAFKAWLISNHKGEDWVGTGAIDVPAYLYFSEVRRLPVGTWCIHFTPSEAFDVFEQGTTIEGLALSSHKREKDPVDREKNLTEDIGSAEIVYGFAFEASMRNVLSVGRKYGSNAVLFQTDAGVRAWHIGDEEYQVIFPLTSEYNVIPLYDPRPGEITVQTDSGDAVTFKTLEEVIAYAEHEPAVRKNPSGRLVRIR
jgi:hypothetical protein